MTVVVKWLILVSFRVIVVGYYLEDYKVTVCDMVALFFCCNFLGYIFFEDYKVKMVLR